MIQTTDVRSRVVAYLQGDDTPADLLHWLTLARFGAADGGPLAVGSERLVLELTAAIDDYHGGHRDRLILIGALSGLVGVRVPAMVFQSTGASWTISSGNRQQGESVSSALAGTARSVVFA